MGEPDFVDDKNTIDHWNDEKEKQWERWCKSRQGVDDSVTVILPSTR